MKKLIVGIFFGYSIAQAERIYITCKRAPNSREARAYKTMARGIRIAWTVPPSKQTEDERLTVMAVRNRIY